MTASRRARSMVDSSAAFRLPAGPGVGQAPGVSPANRPASLSPACDVRRPPAAAIVSGEPRGGRVSLRGLRESDTAALVEDGRDAQMRRRAPGPPPPPPPGAGDLL